MILDHSARHVYDECHRKYYWTYVKRLDQGRSLAMDEGRMVHDMLYRYYRTGQVAEAMTAQLEKPEQFINATERQLYTDREWAMKELFKGYVKELVPQDNFEYIIGEIPLAWHLGGEYYYVGVIDAFVDVRSVGMMVHEYKRSAMIAANWVAKFQLDAQSTGYVKLARVNKIPSVGVVLSVLRATKYPEYVREPIMTPDWQLDEFEKELRGLIAEIQYRKERTEADGEYETWWPKNTDSCYNYNKPCPYHKLCTEKPDVRNAQLAEGFYKQRAPREEGILQRANDLKRRCEEAGGDYVGYLRSIGRRQDATGELLPPPMVLGLRGGSPVDAPEQLPGNEA